jgi:protein-S-isoprenylcysteine O-methyltransferase Ste14
MKLHAYLDIAGLLIGSVYSTIPLFWLVFHRAVARWRQFGRKAFLVIIPAWAVFIAAAFALAWPLRHLHLYDTKLSWAMGGLFILAGLSIYRSAAQGFDRGKISGLAELEPAQHDQRLVVTGIRTQVRHPIYLGHLCELFGWTLGTGSLALCALLVFAVLTGAFMLHQEDAELEERFGDLYREYRMRVPALLPKFPI